MKRRPIPVTDKALVEYLERVYGVDVAALKERVGRIAAAAVEYDAAAVRSNGRAFVVEDGIVVQIRCRPAKNRALRRARAK